MEPWKLSNDTRYAFFIPNGEVKYAAMGESISVPSGTRVAIFSSVSYNNEMVVTGKPLAYTGVEVDVHNQSGDFRFPLNRHAATTYGSVTQVNIGTRPGAISGPFLIEESCTLTPWVLFEDTDGTMIRIGSVYDPYPTTTVTLTPSESLTLADIPLQVINIAYANPATDQWIKWAPEGTVYDAYIAVYNGTGTVYSDEALITVNGVSQNQSYTWAPGVVSFLKLSGLASTGNDIICVSFTPPGGNGIIDWIENNIIMTAAVGMAALIGITYLMTRKR
jgi:hypothetical protein